MKTKLIMIRNIIILSIILLSTSCVSTKRFNKIVQKKIDSQSQQVINTNDIYIIKNQIQNNENLVESEKIKSQFIPALLYWQWDNTIKCNIVSSVATNFLEQSIAEDPQLYELKEKLNGKIVEIEIDSIPKQFIYTNQGNTIILIIFYTVSTLEAIIPSEQYLKATYSIIDNDKIIKTGEIEIISKDIPMKNVWSSTQKFTNSYLNQYKNNIKLLSEELITQIIENL